MNSQRIVLCKDFRALRQRILQVVEIIPYYRTVNLEALKKAANAEELLDALPILDKKQLITLGNRLYEFDERLIAVFSETSGTTGDRPLVTPRSAEELRWNSRNIATAFASRLTRGLDRVAILHPAIMSPFAEACGVALFNLGISFLRVFPIRGVCDYKRLIRILNDYEITTVMTTPSLANKLLYEKNHQFASQPWRLNKFLLTGEVISEAYLENIRTFFAGKSYPFVYGSSESATCCLGNSGPGYSPILQDFVFELHEVGADEKNPTYELVITWLNSGMRPLIRYNTHDIFRFDAQRGTLVALGRNLANSLSADETYQIDSAIHSLSFPIYHFDVAINGNSAQIEVISDRNIGVTTQRQIEADLKDRLAGWFREVQVTLNPSEHEFMQFNPLIKTSRFMVAPQACLAIA